MPCARVSACARVHETSPACITGPLHSRPRMRCTSQLHVICSSVTCATAKVSTAAWPYGSSAQWLCLRRLGLRRFVTTSVDAQRQLVSITLPAGQEHHEEPGMRK